MIPILKYTKSFIICLLAVVICFSCNETPSQNAVYITGAEFIPVSTFSVKKDNDSLTITASSANIVPHDVKVRFVLDPNSVAEYNANNKTNYQVVPIDAVSFTSDEATIKKGTYISNSVNLVINKVADIEEGITYMLPVKVISNNNDYAALRGSNIMFYIVNRSIITKAPKFNGSNYLRVKFKNVEKYKDMNAFTIEARVSLWKFPVYYGGNLMGIIGYPEKSRSAWLFVDGTPDRVGGPGNKPAFMLGVDEWSTWLGKLGTPPENSLNQWFHVAGVYSNNILYLYVDGKLVGSTPYNAPITFTKNFCIGGAPGAQNGFCLRGSVSEARFWSRALTESELKNPLHKCFVNPKSPNLEAYWRLNDEKDICEDLTGNGNVAEKEGIGNLQWVDNVTCP